MTEDVPRALHPNEIFPLSPICDCATLRFPSNNFYSPGNLFALVCGAYLSWRDVCVMGLLMGVALIALVMLLPETPFYLLKNGDYKAILALVNAYSHEIL